MRQLLKFSMVSAIFSLAVLAQGQATAPAASPATKPVDYYAMTTEAFFKLPEAQERIKKESVDIALLDAAIFHQSNRERATQKLPLFKHSSALQLMARRHSTEMATLQFFEHVSPTPANRTMVDRLKNVGLVNVTAGENIAVLPAKEMGSGHYIVKTNPDGTESWIDEANGKVIDYYTYAQLAEAVVTQWMNSPGHRANMVDKRFIYLGTGAARGNYDKAQDSFYMTQNFSSAVTSTAETKAAKELMQSATGPK